MQRTTITLPQGVAEGFVEGAVQRFYSLPYAASLTRERRFKVPAPAEAWTGVRDATRPGPSAPQSTPATVDEIDVEALMGAPTPLGPDYLTLNVFAPEAVGSGRPVMVFVHGGSFVAGSKDASIYDGSAFARDGVVCVVINYRVGIEGFLPLVDAPTNLGLRDMIAALQWVRANIHLFGGDAGNVTFFGESGGAFCVAALMTSPLAKGLFHRAICQSGHVYLSRDLAIMERVRKRLAKRLGVTPDRDGFLSVSTEKMLAAQAWVMAPSFWLDLRDREGRDPTYGLTRFMPVHGDDVLPQPAIEALAAGAGSEIDLLIGTTSEEAKLFFAPENASAKINRWLALYILGRAIPNAKQALIAYGLNERGRKPGEVLTEALTDLMFRAMARRTAELHRGRTWVYEFDWPSPALGGRLGAAHAIELPFVFDTLACASGERGLLGAAPPQRLADFIHALWIEFASEGAVPWGEFDRDGRQVYSLTRRTTVQEPVTPAAAFLP